MGRGWGGGAYEEEAKVESHEEEEGAEGVERVGDFAVGGPFDEGAGAAGGEAGAEEEEREGGDDEGEEARGADSPGEANLGDEVLDCGGEEDAAHPITGGGDSEREGPVRVEIGVDDGEGRHEHDAEAEAGAEALGEEELPVGGGEAGHKGAEDDEERAGRDGGADVAGVGEAPGKGASEEGEGRLEGADPRDLRLGQAEGVAVVQLINAKCCWETPCQHADQAAGEDLGPGEQSSIWGDEFCWAGT